MSRLPHRSPRHRSAPRPRRRATALAATTTLAAAALVAPATSGAQTTTVDPDAARPALAATVRDCVTALTAAGRTATFAGSMPAIDRATSMAMQFQLFERPDGASGFTRLKLPAFSAWVRSEQNVSGFVYEKRVEQLAAPSSYRVRVRYRWFDARGRIVRRAERTSAVCKQPDLRPDARVGRLVIGAPRADGTAPYTVTVRNAGPSAIADPFMTAIVVNGTAQPAVRLAELAAGGSSTFTIFAPRCAPGSAVLVTVDAAGEVDEADETDDTIRRTCPA